MSVRYEAEVADPTTQDKHAVQSDNEADLDVQFEQLMLDLFDSGNNSLD